MRKQGKASRVRYVRAKAIANQIFVESLLRECFDCENEDPLVLQWDHECPGRNISSFYNGSRALITAELDKCVIRCSNCHVRRHRLEKIHE